MRCDGVELANSFFSVTMMIMNFSVRAVFDVQYGTSHCVNHSFNFNMYWDLKKSYIMNSSCLAHGIFTR